MVIEQDIRGAVTRHHIKTSNEVAKLHFFCTLSIAPDCRKHST